MTTPDGDVYVVDEVLDWIDAGDKAGQWNAWYETAIPLAERRYEAYVKRRAGEEGGQ